MKKIIGGIGYRMDGVPAKCGAFADPNTVVSKFIESLSPTLKQAIQKFNSSIK